MKRKLFTIFLTGMCFLSCEDKQTDSYLPPSFYNEEKANISAVDFSGRGGETNILLSCNGAWTASSSPTWLTVSPTKGSGSTTLHVASRVNTERSTRLGIIMVECEEENILLSVTQDGTWFEPSADTLHFSSKGGTEKITLDSNVKWNIKNSNSWLEISTEEGENSGETTVSVSDNASSSVRKGKIIFSSDGYELPVTIVQDARFLLLEQDSIPFSSEGGDHEIKIKTDGITHATTSAEWFSINLDNGCLTISATENTSNYARKDSIDVFLTDLEEGSVKKAITVWQNGFPFVNGYGVVDLGLPSGLLWTTCNIGASSPEEIGNEYAWGETYTKEVYDCYTYKWRHNWWGEWLEINKYIVNTYASNFPNDNKSVLEPEDDAATKNLGEQFRTPTFDEWGELIKNSTYEPTIKNGKKGLQFTSKINNNSIFFPESDYWTSTLLREDVSNQLHLTAYGNGKYWSLSGCWWAYDRLLLYDKPNISSKTWNKQSFRYLPLNVRSVCQP